MLTPDSMWDSILRHIGAACYIIIFIGAVIVGVYQAYMYYKETKEDKE